MYTKEIPDGLTKTFLDYMTGDYAKVVATWLSYVDYNQMSSEALGAHRAS